MCTKTTYQRLAVGIIIASLVATHAYAEQMVLKYRNVQQKNDVNMQHQSEDKSNGSGTYRSQGLTFFEDGSVATYVIQGSFSYSKNGSWHTGYLVRTYQDGSTTTGHFMGQAHKGTPPYVREWNGTVKVIDGTGKFKLATGDGTYKGGRYANGMGVSEIEMKMILSQ